MRVLLASITCEKGDHEANLPRHVQVLTEGRHKRCDLVVFPEFSLTGSVDPVRHPEQAVRIDDPPVRDLVHATHQLQVAALFGIAERSGDEIFITQIYAWGGHILGTQRKRHLAEDEQGYSVGTDSTIFELGSARFAAVICAEGGPDLAWDSAMARGAQAVFFCSAPGLYGRRTDEAGWRAGLEWWESCGLADAKRHASRCGLWVGMATQAGSVIDEDFPGVSALVSPSGEVIERTDDWRPGALLVDIPIDIEVESVT